MYEATGTYFALQMFWGFNAFIALSCPGLSFEYQEKEPIAQK